MKKTVATDRSAAATTVPRLSQSRVIEPTRGQEQCHERVRREAMLVGDEDRRNDDGDQRRQCRRTNE